MGGAKTAQAIIAAQFLHDAEVIDDVIVVAPASIRPKVWFDEDLGQLREQTFLDKRNVVVEFHARIRSWASGPKDARPLRWFVTNYEFIRSRANLDVLLVRCSERTMLILDESSAVRGYDSAQTEACMLLRWKANDRGRPMPGVPRCGRVLLLNGTPVAESPLDLFAQGNLMHPSILDCRYVTHFKARYAVQEPVLERGKPMMRHGRVVQQVSGWSNEGVADLQRRFAPYVLRREAKDLGIDFALPPVCLEVRLTEATWRTYRAMRDELVAWLKGGVATAATAAIKTVRLSQITSGFVGGVEDPDVGAPLEDLDEVLNGLDFDGLGSFNFSFNEVEPSAPAPAKKVESVQFVGREKLDFALEWQAELLRRHPDLKLLTWCRFVPELRRYILEVDARFGHPTGVACGQSVFEGSSVRREREQALRLLHPKTAPAGPCTVGATQGTGALGLNFTACRTVLDLSYDFSPWKKRQGDSRVNRPGQTGPVSFHYLVAVGPKGQKTIDHHVVMTRLGKMHVNDMTVSAWVKALTEE